MLGLGERDHEIMEAMDDLREAKVDILTFGQYLRPTPNHLPVERYVSPDEFEAYRREGMDDEAIKVLQQGRWFGRVIVLTEYLKKTTSASSSGFTRQSNCRSPCLK